MGRQPMAIDGERKHMKKLAFVLVGAGALLTAACNKGNEDQVNNAEMNQPAPELNALANEANAVSDNTVNPKDADEQNVSGM